jgi:hypothetical protein
MCKTQKRMLKNYTHEKPKLFLAIDADNVSEFFYKKIKSG